MQTPQLQPMGIGDILDAAIRIYRNNFRTMLTVGAALLVPVALLQLFSLMFFGDDTLIDLLGNGVALPIVIGALTAAAGAAWMGQTATADEALGAARGRALSLIGGTLLVGLLVAAALIPVIFALFFMFGSDSPAPLVVGVLVGVPLAVFVQVRLCLVFPAIVLEDSGAAGSIGRSWRLTRGHGWRVLLTVIGLGLLTLLIQGSGQLIGAGTGRAGQIVLETCAQLLTLPLQAVVYVMVYYDLRVRDEGLDLEIRNANPGLEV